MIVGLECEKDSSATRPRVGDSEEHLNEAFKLSLGTRKKNLSSFQVLRWIERFREGTVLT